MHAYYSLNWPTHTYTHGMTCLIKMVLNVLVYETSQLCEISVCRRCMCVYRTHIHISSCWIFDIKCIKLRSILSISREAPYDFNSINYVRKSGAHLCTPYKIAYPLRKRRKGKYITYCLAFHSHIHNGMAHS